MKVGEKCLNWLKFFMPLSKEGCLFLTLGQNLP